MTIFLENYSAMLIIDRDSFSASFQLGFANGSIYGDLAEVCRFLRLSNSLKFLLNKIYCSSNTHFLITNSYKYICRLILKHEIKHNKNLSNG